MDKTRPFLSLGNRLLSVNAESTGRTAAQSVVLGIATGFLWAPCAGPILGLILTGAAINGLIPFRFHARDLHLVFGPIADGKPVRFRVTIDDNAPQQDHGTDIDAQGNGVVRAQQLYQLIRQSGSVRDCTFTIEFLDPGVQAYSFTFG